MATLPRATTNLSESASTPAAGVDLVCVVAPVAQAADITPRMFGNAQAIYEMHGYSKGVAYAALHLDRTRKSVLFVGIPIGTEGAVGRHNTSGNAGTSVTSVVAGVGGCLDEHEGVVRVITGGTVGTDQIVLGLSLDGGRTETRVRLGTALSYAIPYFNVTISFTVGTLIAGDTVHVWHGTAPKGTAVFGTVRTALAAQPKAFRSIVNCDRPYDLDTDASDFKACVESYATLNERFIYGRAEVRDRLPLATLSLVTRRMTGNPSLTFAEVGATGDTITRSAGSWISDGFVVGDYITVSGSVSNNVSGVIAALTATVLTLNTTDLNPEGPVAGVSVTASEGLIFEAAGDTVTRSRGSWIDDGFRVGSAVTIAGTTGNNGTFTISAVTATVLTVTAGFAAESRTAAGVSISSGETKAAWMAAIDAEFAPITAAPRIDLAAGRGRVLCPFTGWALRRSPAWAASVREYQHDLHVATWRKSDGPTDFDLLDSANNLAEWDDRVDGGAAVAARFTCFRTWANGPVGAFVALSLTRAVDGSILSLTHNEAVVNLACSVVHAATENAIGRSLVLKDDGTATADSLSTIQSEVNAALELALLKNSRGEGQRASKALWTPSASDVLNVPDATLTGVLDLNLNGTIHSTVTTVRVRSGGQ